MNTKVFDIGDEFTLTFYSQYGNPPAGYKSFETPVLASADPKGTMTTSGDHAIVITITEASVADATYKYQISGFRTPFSQIATSYAQVTFKSGTFDIAY
jgi:hypothetical protein